MWQQQIIDPFAEVGAVFPVLIAIGIDGGETSFLPDEFALQDALAIGEADNRRAGAGASRQTTNRARPVRDGQCGWVTFSRYLRRGTARGTIRGTSLVPFSLMFSSLTCC